MSKQLGRALVVVSQQCAHRDNLPLVERKPPEEVVQLGALILALGTFGRIRGEIDRDGLAQDRRDSSDRYG